MPHIANRILAATEPATEERRDALVAAARDRADRNLGGLAQLLEERPAPGRAPAGRPGGRGDPMVRLSGLSAARS